MTHVGSAPGAAHEAATRCTAKRRPIQTAIDRQPTHAASAAERQEAMADHRQRTGRPRGGPVRWARRATWTLVLGAALTLSAPPPSGWAATGAAVKRSAVAPEPPRYTLVSLGTLGGETSQALGINARGEVVGDSTRRDGSTHGFLWRDGKMTDLGTLPGANFSSAQDVNDHGMIVGAAGVSGGQRSAVVWTDGKPRSLGTLAGGGVSIGLAINNAGVVVGISQSSEGNRAFVWRDGEMRSLGVLPGGGFSLARDVNEKGVIVGQSQAADGSVHATRWRNGRIEDLGQITTASGAAASSVAYAIGPDGLTVGYGTTDGGALGAVWTGVDPRPVASLTGYTVAELLGLNGFRQAVGDATDSEERRQVGVIVDLRRVPKAVPALFDLNTLVMNGAGWTIRTGTDLNDRWEVVGTGTRGGPDIGVLLRPRPFAVSVVRDGSGAGTVSGSGGIHCGRRCTSRVEPGRPITLHARPAPGSRFAGWKGACSGASPTCRRAVDGAIVARAVFTSLPKPCRCTSLTTSASIAEATQPSSTSARVRIDVHWQMHCASGTGNACQGELRFETTQPGVTLSAPSGRVSCVGTCPATGEGVVSGVVTVRLTAIGVKRVTLLVHKYCRTGGQLEAVGVDRVELTLVSSG